MKTFPQFIRAQEPERKIVHSSWNACAVGDYYTYMGKERTLQFGDEIADYLAVPRSFISELCGANTYADAQDIVKEFNL